MPNMSCKNEIDSFMHGAHHPQVNSILVWERGEIIAECYYNGFTSESRNNIKSVSKSILSAAIGIACDEGVIHIEDPICKYIPEFNEQRDVRHKLIKIKHLLTMSSGIYWVGGVHYHCPILDAMKSSKDWISFISDCAVNEVPGSRHNYKEWDVILLGQILTNCMGDAFDYIQNKLYLPLGIESGRWFTNEKKVCYSIALDEELEKTSDLSARDMLKLGILFYNSGTYENKQILSEAYIKQAISPSPQDKGYGYLWWRGEDWYGCRGYGGQSVTVFPKMGRIVVTQATATSRPLSYNDIIFDVCKNL